VAAGAADAADALLFYDMPGYTFADGTVKTAPPSPGFKERWSGALPADGAGDDAPCDRRAGGMAAVERMAGRAVPLSARRGAGPRRARFQAIGMMWTTPPNWWLGRGLGIRVLEGVPATFPVNDELDLGEVFEADVTPLIRARHDYCLPRTSIPPRMPWRVGCSTMPIGRIRRAAIWWRGPSRLAAREIVYCQFGDGPTPTQTPPSAP